MAAFKGGSDTLTDLHSVKAWLDATVRHRHRALPGCCKFQGEEYTSCFKTSSLTCIKGSCRRYRRVLHPVSGFADEYTVVVPWNFFGEDGHLSCCTSFSKRGVVLSIKGECGRARVSTNDPHWLSHAVTPTWSA